MVKEAAAELDLELELEAEEDKGAVILPTVTIAIIYKFIIISIIFLRRDLLNYLNLIYKIN